MQYWLIKSLLILGMVVVLYFILRPVRTQNSLALRRLTMLVAVAAAVFAIIFPEVFNSFANLIGVMSGTNLLVYLLVIAFLAQMTSTYRRDAAAEKKLTALARQVALQNARLGLTEEEIAAQADESSTSTKTPDADKSSR